MKTVTFFCLLAIAGSLCAGPAFAVSSAWAQEKDPAKEREKTEVREMVKETLNKLYSLAPASKTRIRKAAGYAVFSSFGMKILFAGGGSGKGIAVSNATGKETFMKMVEVQAGLGFGLKKFRLVWVFQTEEALNSFIFSGWELGSQTTAAAQYEDMGMGLAGTIAISKDVWLYQLTDDGLALELTAKGTKYYRDDELN